jgi:hypothetical protein
MLEERLQSECVVWFKNEHRSIRDMLYMIKNHGKKGKATAVTDTAMGLTKGIPDLFLSIPNRTYHGLYIEMKKAGFESKSDQIRVHEQLTKNGYRVAVIDNKKDFESLIHSYLDAV